MVFDLMRDMGIDGRKRAADLLLLPIFFIIFLGRFQAVSGLNDTKYGQVSSLRLEIKDKGAFGQE